MKDKIKNYLSKFLKSDLFFINIICLLAVGTTATLLFFQELKKIYFVNTRDAVLLIIICGIIWYTENKHKEKNKNSESKKLWES